MNVADFSALGAVSRRSMLKLGAAFVGGTIAAGILGERALAEPEASEATRNALASARERLEAAKAELAAIGEELETLTHQRAETEAKIAEVEGKIQETEEAIRERTAELEEAKGVLGRRVASSYKAGPTNSLAVLMASATWDELISNIYYMDKIAASDAAAIEEVERIRAELEDQKASLEQQKADLDSLKADLDSQIAQIEDRRAAQQAVLNGLDAEVRELMEQERREIEAAREAERRAAEEAARRAAEEEAARQAAEEARRAAAAASASSARSAAASSGYTSTPSAASGDLRSRLVSAATSLIGVPYIYGGTWPDSGGTDCSGLMQYAFSTCGYSIPRTTYDQIAALGGNRIYDTSALQPGDLIFYNGGGHVGMYIGNGNMVHASTMGYVVRVTPITYNTIYCMGFPV